MATVGRIVVEIDADTVKFVKGLDRSQKKQRQWGQQIRRGAGRAVKRFGQVLAAASVALVAFTIRGVKMGDQLAKTAAKLGTTATALEGLRFAAQQTGVEVRQLDLGIQRMTRRISEAAIGMGEAQGAIRELGLDAKDLAALPIEQQFLAIADAMEGVESGSTRIRLGFKLFDSEGVSLINTLGAGREALQDFFDEAKELGLFLTNTQTRVVEESSDAMGKLGSSFKGLSLQLGATFGPAIEAGANSITEFVARITNGLPQMAAFVSHVFDIQRAVTDMSMTHVNVELELFRAELVETMRDIQANRRVAENARGTTKLGLEKAGEGLLDEQIRLLERINALTERQRVLRAEAAEPVEVEGLVRASDALQEIVVTATKLGDVPQIELLDVETFLSSTERMKEGMDRFGDNAGSALQSTFTSALLGMETSFSGMLKRMAAEFAASSILQALFLPLAGAGGVFGGIASAILPGFQHGGSFQVAGAGGADSQVVAFRATPGEQVSIIPSGGSGGGVSIINQMNLTVLTKDNPNDIRREVGEAIAASSEQTVARVRDLMQRGRFR